MIRSLSLVSTLQNSNSPPIHIHFMHSYCHMAEFNTSKRKMPLDIDYDMLFSTDDAVDYRPPELVITPADKSKGGGDVLQRKTEEEDLEYKMEMDGELENKISRLKTSILTLGYKLPDKGEKLKATLQKCVAEAELRKKIHLDKSGTRKAEAIQLSDQSDYGASCRKEKSGQKSPSKFGKIFSQMLNEDKDSRTVNAFQEEFSFMNPSQGRKMKQKCWLLGRGQSTLRLSSRREPFRCPTTLLVDKKKQRISKSNRSATSSPCHFFRNRPGSFFEYERARAPQDQLSTKLKPTHPLTYCLVDEEPLHSDTTHYSENLSDCMKDVKVYYPSRDDQDSVEVVYTDMKCLAPEACLSSTIMNFYIRYLQQMMSSSENGICKYHFFNTYFYNKLHKLSYREDSFLKLRKWWKGVNIFEKAYILLPVHEKAHWSLGIICLPTNEDELGPIVLHLDSLGLHHSRSIFDNIRSFVKEEWRYLRNSEVPLNLPIKDEIWVNLDCRMDDRIIPVPHQRNGYDCGLFVLFYMERFIKEAPERLREQDLSMFSKQWFRPEEASNLRVRISDVLKQEFKIAKEKQTSLSPKC